MKFILSLLAVAFVFLAAGAAIGSDLENEWDGKYAYRCSFLRAGVSAEKALRADNDAESDQKFAMWVTRNSVPAANAACSCNEPKGCE